MPAWHSLPAAPLARHRSPRQGRDSSQEKNVETVGLDDSFGEPARHWSLHPGRTTCPASEPRHVSYVITNYEAVSDYVGHWLHRAQVSLSVKIKLSHIRKKPWRGPGAGLVRAWCGNLCRRGVGAFDAPTRTSSQPTKSPRRWWRTVQPQTRTRRRPRASQPRCSATTPSHK